MGIVVFLLIGLVAGFIARALVPGPDPMGWLGTLILGVIGSFVGGTLAALIFGGSFEISAAGTPRLDRRRDHRAHDLAGDGGPARRDRLRGDFQI